MTETQILASEISSLYGTIKRARGPYLYTAKGVRLTDCFQEGGRGILGWGSEGTKAFTVFKNVISRGISGSFETDFGSRSDCKSQLSRAVSELLGSERTAYIFDSKEKALKAGLSVSSQSTSLFRPWNTENVNWRSVDCIVFAPVLPWADSSWIAAVDDEIVIAAAALADQSVKIPAPLEAAFTRSVYDLIKALQNRQEKDWFIYDTVLTKYFERKGPWLFPKVPEDKYWEFLTHCLKNGVVVSPVYKVPSIVPYGADKGSFRKLEKNPFNF